MFMETMQALVSAIMLVGFFVLTAVTFYIADRLYSDKN
jgi:hypothetical protein